MDEFGGKMIGLSHFSERSSREKSRFTQISKFPISINILAICMIFKTTKDIYKNTFHYKYLKSGIHCLDNFIRAWGSQIWGKIGNFRMKNSRLSLGLSLGKKQSPRLNCISVEKYLHQQTVFWWHYPGYFQCFSIVSPIQRHTAHGL